MEEAGEWVNEVRLVGRISAAAAERKLPSGDVLVTWRLVVPRPPNRARSGRGGRAGGSSPGPGGGAATVDTIDVACWSGRTRLAARRLVPGDTVEVVGQLRRRFYRAGAATASRYEVEAIRVVRHGRSVRRTSAS